MAFAHHRPPRYPTPADTATQRCAEDFEQALRAFHIAAGIRRQASEVKHLLAEVERHEGATRERIEYLKTASEALADAREAR